MKFHNDLRFLLIRSAANSLFDLIAYGNYRPTHLGRETWKSLISHSPLQKKCNQEGFNVVGTATTPHARVRIGLIANQEHDCNTPDSFIGFGGPGADRRSHCPPKHITNTCGNSATHCHPDNGAKELKAMGYIFVR